MNDLTLEELTVLLDVFSRASLQSTDTVALQLQQTAEKALQERTELEDLDFEDCISCKL